jgi:hypothetical protein
LDYKSSILEGEVIDWRQLSVLVMFMHAQDPYTVVVNKGNPPSWYLTVLVLVESWNYHIATQVDGKTGTCNTKVPL